MTDYSDMASTPAPARRSRKRRSGCFVFAVVAVAGLGLVGLFMPFFQSAVVPAGSVLVVDVRDALPEHSELDMLEQLFGVTGNDLVAVHAAVSRAARDPRVSGLLLRVGRPAIGLGRIEELRSLVERFRGTGKFVVSVLESADTRGYFLASAADEVYVDRIAGIDLLGLQAQAVFVGDVLGKVGLEADMVRVGRYKGAYEQLVGSEATPEFREALQATLDSLFSTVVEGIASGRGMSTDQVERLIDEGPLTPERALEANLVDGMLYRDEVLATLTKSHRGNVPLTEVSVSGYLGASARLPERGVALVHVTGTIVDRQGNSLTPMGGIAGADRFRQAIRAAREDVNVAAVVVRVDSPGGTLSGSEAMWREMMLTKAVKPVVVSMGDVAASGGYYIATGAHRVVAQRGSITGSIGVFGGKFVLGGLLKKLGAHVETASRGAHAGLFDTHRSFNDEERQTVEKLLGEAYAQFLARVSTGREFGRERAESLAEGRVWTGQQALENGLVDVHGGLAVAIEEAQQLAGLGRNGLIEPVLFPAEKSLLDLFAGPEAGPGYLRSLRQLSSGSMDGGAFALSIADALDRLGIFDGGKPLALLPYVLRVR